MILAGKFEEQMTALIREDKGDGEYLSVHHPEDVKGAKDDAPGSTCLSLWASAGGGPFGSGARIGLAR